MRTTLLMLTASLLVPLLWGCSHDYVYRANNVPPIQDGYASIQKDAKERPREHRVNRIYMLRPGVDTAAGAGELDLRPTRRELDAILQGKPLPDIDGVVVEVSTSTEIWEDYARWGFGFGLGLGAVAGGMAAFDISGGSDDTPPMVAVLGFGALFGLALGFEGMGIGALIGTIATSGTTDMRLNQ